MATFEEFVQAELPNRPAIIRGLNGDPNISPDSFTNSGPAGTLYLQEDEDPKVLWVKQITGPAGSTSWVAVGVSSGFLFRPESWDPDTGTVPEAVQDGDLIFSRFDKNNDTAIYTDVTLTDGYDKDETLHCRIIYKAQDPVATNDISWISDYIINEAGTAVNTTFTEVRQDLEHVSGTGLKSVVLQDVVPAQSGTTGELVATFRVGREGSDAADLLDSAIDVLAIEFFQGDVA